MVSPRFDVSAKAGVGIPSRWLIWATLVAILGTALPARGQRPLGSFPSDRWEDLESRESSEDVLPFVKGTSDNLVQPAGDAAKGESVDNPWMESAPSEAPALETAADDVADDALAEGETETTAKTASAEQTSPPAEIALPTIPAEPTPPAPTSPEPVANAPSLAAPSAPEAPAIEESHSAARGPVLHADREIEAPPVEPRNEQDAAGRDDASTSDIMLVDAETPPADSEPSPEPASAAPSDDTQSSMGASESSESVTHNPFTPSNIMQWCWAHGPPLLAILIGALVLRFAATLFSGRIVSVLARSGPRGTREEREDRAKTLVGVFLNAASLLIVVGGILMACEEVGIAVGPLLGGAAVFGLAAAFGAQNLIRDYFYGFMILLENQYKINDIVKVGGVSGQVERITMRITVLRDLEGNVHFVPNGQIETVTNMSHGWSCSLLEIRVAYQENVDRVMQLLLEMAAELRQDPEYGPLILEDAQMLGVDSLGDSAVNIKLVIKTRPLKQWAVRRELLRRIKRRFEELKIEIPYPHRTVLHRSAGSAVESIGGSSPWDGERAA